ncbi:MAG TPA: hydantoinase B/oxoprolinase family protein [Nitrolancea sp.]|nr:hydantoinase B/oxoprolinase family protein [Nitrolancea sp.]
MARDFSPIELRVLWNRLIAIVDEAAATLVRTSFSTLVRESNDFACVLFDAQGRSLAQNSAAIPSFIGTLPITMRHFLARFPADSLRPGDVLITNDPWLATGHLPDITIARPIFRNGQLVAFSGSVAHSPDIGGRIRSPDARQVYEEGLRIPPMKLYAAGQRNELLLELLEANVRVPRQVTGDLLAQVAANELLARRLLVLLDEQGLDDLGELARVIQERSARAMRRAIAALPDGSYEGEAHPDGLDEPLDIRLRLTIAGEEITVDYAGSSPQVDYAVNTVLNYTFAYTAYPLKCITSPAIPNNEGSFEPIRVSAPEGSLLNPRFPAPVGGRALIGHFLAAAIFQALAPVAPAAVQAASGSPLWCLHLTGEERGRAFSSINFLNGGQGASLRQDGLSCLSFPSNVANTPVEVMEALAPLVVERKALRPDSGGAGRQRGGLGQELQVRITAEQPVTVAFLADRLRRPADGLLGGGPGASGQVLLNGAPINPKRQIVVKGGDTLLLATPGGGGFGEPPERDQQALAQDLANGLVAPEAAAGVYGAGRVAPAEPE